VIVCKEEGWGAGGREQGFVKLIKAVSQSLKLKVHFKGCVYSISMQQVNNTFKREFSKKF